MLRVRCHFFEVEDDAEGSARRSATTEAIETDACGSADIRHNSRAFEEANPVFGNTSVVKQRLSFAVDDQIRLDGLCGARGQEKVIDLFRLCLCSRRLLHDHYERVEARELARGADRPLGRVPGEEVLRVLVKVEVQKKPIF